MYWGVEVSSTAYKQLRKFPEKEVKKITKALEEFSVNPWSGDVRKSESDDNVWRRRVGSYRIIYEIYTSEKVVYISDIRRRTTTTY